MLRKKRKVNMSMKPSMNRNMINHSNIKIKKGEQGENVKKLQEMLVDLVELYPSIPMLKIDGMYGEETMKSVKRFQELMGIYDTGIVDMLTWSKLQLIHSKRSALESNLRHEVSDNEGLDQSNNVVKEGSQGRYVAELQEYINKVANIFPAVPKVKIDGFFGPETKNSIITFQRMFGLEPDAVVGQITWTTLYNASLGKITPNIT